MNHFASKVDNVQAGLVQFLRSFGATWQPTFREGKGCPDGVVGFLGINEWVEFKTGTAQPSVNQIQWHRSWKGGKVNIIRDQAGAASLLAHMREKSRAILALTKNQAAIG